MVLRLVNPPSGYPVTLAEVKAHCLIEDAARDGYIDGLIAAATRYVEVYTDRAILTQTWDLMIDGFEPTVHLPKGSIQSVSSIKYYDTDGVLRTVDVADYQVDTDGARICPAPAKVWPATQARMNAVEVRFVAGTASAPLPIKQAMLILIASWYEVSTDALPENLRPVPHGVAALLANYRLNW